LAHVEHALDDVAPDEKDASSRCASNVCKEPPEARCGSSKMLAPNFTKDVQLERDARLALDTGAKLRSSCWTAKSSSTVERGVLGAESRRM
jgi:hypothetical protein